MKNITLLILALTGLVYITPCYSFDFKNMLFGGNDDQMGNDAAKGFGYKLPPRLVNQQPSSDQVCRNGYLCQDTKKCVTEPRLCPCRLEAHIKCQLGEDWYTCIRGDQKCDQVVGDL